MTRPPLFISAPFAAPTTREVRLNIARATALGRLAIAHGYAPIVPHTAVAMLLGCEDSKDARALSLDLCLAHLEAIRRDPLAKIYVLLRDNGTPSPGVLIEREAWEGRPSVTATWAGWRDLFEQQGEDLLDLYNDPGVFWTAPVLRGG
jgi:hypothetical protein